MRFQENLSRDRSAEHSIGDWSCASRNVHYPRQVAGTLFLPAASASLSTSLIFCTLFLSLPLVHSLFLLCLSPSAPHCVGNLRNGRERSVTLHDFVIGKCTRISTPKPIMYLGLPRIGINHIFATF